MKSLRTLRFDNLTHISSTTQRHHFNVQYQNQLTEQLYYVSEFQLGLAMNFSVRKARNKLKRRKKKTTIAWLVEESVSVKFEAIPWSVRE